MLVLTRRVGEVIRIGDDIIVQVLDVNGGQVRIGVTAPAHVAVHRQEIYDRVQRDLKASPRVAAGKTRTLSAPR